MPNTSDSDNRLSFRIKDQALIELVPLAEDAATVSLDSVFSPCAPFKLLADLQQLDTALQHQLFKLAETNTLLAGALQLLNRKLERLALQVGAEDPTQALQPITISEGGLSLQTLQPLAAGSLCAMRIRLLPGGYAIQTLARVSYCLVSTKGTESTDTIYLVGLYFVALDKTGRDLIARHILEHQALSRRMQRQQLDDDSAP
ncbi:MAG: PilZ domain-containing protein [Motiliproteus sp.]